MYEFLGVTVLVVVMAGLMWEISRRRARAEQDREELRPYAMLGENMEGVAHDSRKLLRAARENLELLARQPDADPAKLAALARAQVKQAESFLFALGTPPDQVLELDAVGILRLVASLLPQRQRIDTEDIDGAINVEGRPEDVGRVFSNLMVNALEHSEGTVRVCTDGTVVRVENPLEGDGETPGDEIYQRGQSSQGKGRGLGLALVKELCQGLEARLGHEVIQRDGQPWISFWVDFEDLEEAV